MEPFRKLLAKNAEYAWTEQLQTAFETAKREVVRLVAQGVSSFRLDQWICIVTDWSKCGVGYVMWQKRCNCSKIHPSCCPGGWVLITCGSRFCTAAESRYHPIEGELLGITYTLEKTAYYTLGSEKLLLLVDHKPLLGLLSTRDIGEIENPRLLHLAEHLLRWRFRIEHIAGAKNFAPDAQSRSPAEAQPQAGNCTRSRTISRLNYVGQSAQNFVSQDHQLHSDELEAQVLASTANQEVAITSWSSLKNAGISDPEYLNLLHLVNSNSPEADWTDSAHQYKQFRDELSSVDRVVTFKGRAVVPMILRDQVLTALHQAHQGVLGMSLRSQKSVWWPGIMKDMETTRALCTTCRQNAPSQSPLPPVHPPLPDHPFELVSSDFFQVEGHTYLVLVDRYSNWPPIKK